MNLPGFIARRIRRYEDQREMSRPIVRIATIGIATGMVLMIVSVAVVQGFQREVRRKVIGFGSHFQVVGNENSSSRESTRIDYEKGVYKDLQELEGVSHVQVFALKPGILETKEAIQGVVIKGAGADFDWSYLQSVMLEGSVIRTDSAGDPLREVVISAYIARRMKLQLGDVVSIYFINSNSDARQQNFTIKGIYQTGLEDFDRQYIFTDIRFIQKYSGWGTDVQILADSVCRNGFLTIGAAGFGGSGELSFDWPGMDWSGEGPHYFVPERDTSLTVVVRDEAGTVPDTASVFIDFANDDSDDPCRPFSLIYKEGMPSESKYIGGYEVTVKEYDLLSSAGVSIQRVIPFYLTAVSITERNPDVFSWLEMLDINVVIIIFMMICISVVNMTSALLIIILERQSMIGTLKAFGMRNAGIMEIFLINSAWIVGRGLFWGNLIGCGIILIQQYTGLIELDPESYYVDKVPVLLSVWNIVVLNLGTLLICVGALVFPALYVTGINPIRSIRFN